MATNQVTGYASGAAIAAQLDAVDDKLDLSGGTLTGALTLSGDPTNTNHAANKNYVDTQDDARVAVAGDTMTGYLTLHADPSSDMQAATKQYVDSVGFGYNTTTVTGSAWNLDNTGIMTKSIAHGLADITKIRSISIMIKNNAGTVMQALGNYGNWTALNYDRFIGGIEYIDATNVVLWAIDNDGGGWKSGSDWNAAIPYVFIIYA